MWFSQSTHLLIFFVFGDFNIHHKDWLTYSGVTDRPGDFATRIPDCDSHNPALLDFFISSDASFCSTMTFPPLGKPFTTGFRFIT